MKLTCSLTIAAGLLMATMANAEGLPAVGATAPDFSLTSQEGTPVSLHDFKGKWVVLYFYPKDMTQGCTIEAHNFQRDLAQYQAKDVTIVGVSVDSVDSHKEFCTKESISFKLLADADKEVTKKYGSMAANNMVAARNTFLIDPSGKVQKVYEKVKPMQHSEEVLAALGTLTK
jgi:peroxiredoxin Q/BCP